MNGWKLWLLGAVGVVALTTITYMYVREQGAAAQREKQYKAQIEAFVKDVAKADEVTRNLEAQLTAMRTDNANLKKELEDETNRNPVYTNPACNVPADGLRLYNAARAAGAVAR